MTSDEKQLLENILDGLDRLFDFESGVVDTGALIFATSKALCDTEFYPILNEAANRLESIERSQLESGDKRLEALKATNDLRIYLARTLPFLPSNSVNT